MEPSSSSSSSSTDPRKVFYDSLTKGINDLESMLQTDKIHNNFMSIQFLERVLSLTRFCHDQMTQCALMLNLPAGGSWFDEYMDETEKLMKATKDIKDCVKRMADYNDHYCTFLTTLVYANRVLNPQACQQMITFITNCIRAEEALMVDNTRLSTKYWTDLTLAVEKVGSVHENLGFNGVIYATRNVCKTLVRILLYGLVHFWEDYKFEKYVMYNHDKDGVQYFDSISSLMVSSTDKLQKSVESEICKLTMPPTAGMLWYEYRILKLCLVELRGEFERVSLEAGGGDVNLDSEGWINETVTNVTRCVEALKGGIGKIIEQIDDFTHEIIQARNKLLQV